MCRGVPARVVRVEATTAWVEEEVGAGALPVSLLAIGPVEPGDYVYHHAGLALETLSAAEAAEVLDALALLERLMLQGGMP